MRENVTLGASVIAAITASLCCLGPLVAALLGLGSFSAATVFEAWRPYLLGVTFALLVAAFSFTYRKREVACEDGPCTRRSASRWNKIALWIVTIVIVLLAAFPHYSGRLSVALNHHTGGQTNLTSPTASERLAKVRMGIKGMTCGGCATSAEVALKEISGVHSATASYEKGEAIVECDPSRVKMDRFVEAVEMAGFTVESVTATLRIEGMTCAGCAESVQQALARREGVKSVEVSFEKQQAVVTYDPVKITLDRLADLIGQVGFKPRL